MRVSTHIQADVCTRAVLRSTTQNLLRRRGFTLIELLVVISIIALLISILLPALGAARQAAWKARSLSNIRQILIGNESYRNDSKGYYPLLPSYTIHRYVPPMGPLDARGTKAYGWCSWSGWGKNNDGGWASSNSSSPSIHDWEAADRQGNPYISENPSATFAPSKTAPLTPESAYRKLEQFIYRDPSDRESYLRNGWRNFPEMGKRPIPLAMSAYDDVGTSYQWNGKWWFHTNFQSYIGDREHNFHEAFKFAMKQLSTGGVINTSRFVLVNDQYADVVALNNSDANIRVLNGYEEYNKSMMGFTDGHAAYLPVYSGLSDKAYGAENYSFIFEFLKPKPREY